MIPSPEYRALLGMKVPDRSGMGDMWLCRRLGIVKVFNGHKHGSRRGDLFNNFHLYHWGKPAMYSRPADWRDNDSNASGWDPAIKSGGETWEYLGNIFELLTYEALTAESKADG